MSRPLSRTTRLLLGLLGLLAVAAALVGWVVWANLRDEDPLDAAADTSATPAPAARPAAGAADRPAAAPAPELVARGAYLARAGNCMGCHTARGGAAYAGGRGVSTPFGTVYAPNLTPDVATGIGAWSPAAFWRALHHGRSRDGRLLYPAFPYPNYTRITRADADAIHAFLRSLPAVTQPNTPHDLAFPFDRQFALAIWRALYFRPVDPTRAPAPPPAEVVATDQADWRRGAYLIEGLGHCNACHASRNALGATRNTLDLAGGLIPVQNWYAPSLTAPDEAGLAAWELPQIVALLRSGVSERGAVMGPMSEVVGGSTQYLNEPDLRAMAVYLKALPPSPGRAPAPTSADARGAATAPPDSPGARLYAQHCVQCHGEQGEGVAGVYRALAGSRAVTLHTPANLVHMVLEGGFPPATAANPRPYGMPPFATVLSDEEVAQLLSHLRGSWGNRAAAVSALEVTRYRGAR